MKTITYKNEALSEAAVYKKLGALTKDKSGWERHIPDLAALLASGSPKIQAKALWLLGEMGLLHPDKIAGCVPALAAFLGSRDSLLRARSLTALGRIGRGDFSVIAAYWKALFRFAKDPAPCVRLHFIWASENIAMNTPEICSDYMDVFAGLLSDADDKVRMEAPEIFRVLGKRRPELVQPYIGQLAKIAEADQNRVVRIHAEGAIRVCSESSR